MPAGFHTEYESEMTYKTTWRYNPQNYNKDFHSSDNIKHQAQCVFLLLKMK